MDRKYGNLLVIMAGGLNNDQTLPDHVIDRCNYAIEVAKPNSLLLASSSFTLNIKPKISSSGNIASESSAIYHYLMLRGTKNPILCDQLSHDSVGSIFFSMEFFATPYSIKTVEFITSDFHAARVDFIAKFINKVCYKNSFEVKITGIKTSYTNPVRAKKEIESTNNFIKCFEKSKSRSDFIFKLFSEHTNYNHCFNSGTSSFIDHTY